MLILEQEMDYQWFSISEDFLPSMAKNQFKEKMNKFMDEAQKDKLSKKVPQ